MNSSKDKSRSFPRGRVIVVLAILASVVLPCHADPYKRWDFDKTGDREGWSVPDSTLGVVMGGSLWVKFTFKETDPRKIAAAFRQVYGVDFYYRDSGDAGNFKEPNNIDILSPRGLDLPASTSDSTQLQVKMRVLNLSPVTDIYLRWRTLAQTDSFSDSRQCRLKSDLKEWQEITCFVNRDWKGRIDQIAIGLAQSPYFPIRGDLWIDRIEIAEGPAETIPPRPDVASANVVPKLTFSGIPQTGFADAFKVLDEALMVDPPGFTYPMMSPGGLYHGNWFLLDAGPAIAGAKWTNQSFAENTIRGFRDAQAANPDGRITGYSFAATRGQVSDLSMLPLIFDTACDVARRTNDSELRGDIYQMMRQYLEWWLSPVKRDARTGLISGSFEETFGEDESIAKILSDKGVAPQSIAPVDLNVLVAAGAKCVAQLANALNYQRDAGHYEQVFQELARAINASLWDEADGVYYNYDLHAQHLRHRMLVTIFDPLRLGIAPPARRERLLQRLLDPAQFNWGIRPLTSAAKTDPVYTEPKQTFEFDAWLGAVWTLRNLQVIRGLKDSEHPDLAAELNWATIREFDENYREYVIPSSGRGGGAKRYAVSAAQYIQAIIENLFGVDFDAIEHRLTIEPHVPKSLYGKNLALENLILPTQGNTRLSVMINLHDARAGKITVKIAGDLSEGSVQIALPGSAKKVVVPTTHSITAVFP
jgi:hypothetical protein